MLLLSALTKLLAGFAMMALLLFLPAGTWHYPYAWLFLGLLFVPMICLGTWLLFKHPELLAKRLNNREKQREQKHVVALSGLMFIGGFVVCGLDFRFGWSHIPLWLVIVASVLLLVGYGLYVEVMRENAYLSRTVEIQEGQQLIDTGLYSIVRHPMYAATLLMYLAMPIVLGSWWALLVFVWYPFIIAKRILNEEQLLSTSLPGYREYRLRIPYRLIPYIW